MVKPVGVVVVGVVRVLVVVGGGGVVGLVVVVVVVVVAAVAVSFVVVEVGFRYLRFYCLCLFVLFYYAWLVSAGII